jgi:hypothetical protein
VRARARVCQRIKNFPERTHSRRLPAPPDRAACAACLRRLLAPPPLSYLWRQWLN